MCKKRYTPGIMVYYTCMNSFPFNFNQRSNGDTTPTFFPGGGTDASFGPSIFDLPVESLRKLEKNWEKDGRSGKDNKQ